MDKVLKVSGLSVHYGTGDARVDALREVDLELAPGDSVGIVGESGSGKSTLGMAVLGLLPKSARIEGSIRLGTVEINGGDPDQVRELRWKYGAMVFQNAMSALNPVMRVGHQIRDAIEMHRELDRKQVEAHAKSLLSRVGIDPERYSSYPHELSGGQRQRVMIALAISCSPALLIADEPTTALDVVVQAEIIELLVELKEELGLALAFISHDLGVVAKLVDRLVVMYAGQVVETGPIEEVLKRQSHPYTAALVGAFPRLSGGDIEALPQRSQTVQVKAGRGCKFADRCPHVQDVCLVDDPAMIEVAAGSGVWSRCHFAGRLQRG